jgi:soluble lytic murein transglycosylase
MLGFASSPPPRLGPASPISGHPDWAALAYTNAAGALRSGNCSDAYEALGPVVATRGSEAAFARLLSGLYAFSCSQTAVAEDRLFNAASPNGPFEDWRLLVLSRAAAAQDHALLAQASLARLIGDYPDSPLRRRAMVEGAELAWKRGDSRRALDLVERARRDQMRGEEGAALDALAWQIGTQLGDTQIRAQAARQLLVHSPSKAAELQVIGMFRGATGALDWGSFLTSDELETRARSLLELSLGTSAVETLDAVTPAQRDLDWSLLRARALTQAHRGREALALLVDRQGASPRENAALEWERATAASDSAVARSGSNLNAAQRQTLRSYAQQRYERVAQIGAEPALAAKALRALYAEEMSDEQFERGIEVLRRLRKLDAKDATGALYLWQVGWREFGRGNYSGAVGYWTELFALYPETSQARSGRYWTGRAFEALGEDERALQIFGELAQADTADFYRRNALGRLRGRSVPKGAQATPRAEAWAKEPALSRAHLLTDVGLDALALEEAKLVGAKADKRSGRALEAVVLARRGQFRDSVLAIRDAFQSLGGPFQATVPEEARRLYYPIAFEDAIRSAAQTNRLPPSLVFGVIRQESAFDLRARSRAGAQGLMQVMPATGRELAGKLGLTYNADTLYDPAVNVQLGTSYLRQVLGMFDDNLELSLAGYNGGPFRIKRMWNEFGSAGEVDRFVEGLNLSEPITYVKRILVLSDSYRQLYPQPG